MEAATIPSIYTPGFKKASATNPALAKLYMKYASAGDPWADEVIEAIGGLEPERAHQLICAGMERQRDAMPDAPQVVRDFFDDLAVPPDWYNRAGACPGRRLFHSHSDLFIPAFFLVTLQNAATLISKAFYATGRVLGGSAHRRIRQNTRHFIEIMLPGSLSAPGDGWKMSVRIRLVHAQVRRMVRESGDWDEAVYGVPLSAAHMGLASANFSATMLRQAERLGVRMRADERAAFMQVWRYASYLIGAPEELLFEGDEETTIEFSRIATMCEPPPSEASVAIANALVRALPDIAEVTDDKAARRFVSNIYRISRAILGNEVADQLQFPRMNTVGLLPLLRLHRRVFHSSASVMPDMADSQFRNHFVYLLEVSQSLDLNYRLPDRLRSEESTPW